MLTRNIHGYLKSLNLTIFVANPRKKDGCDRIFFDYGRLVYRDKNFDKLFITHNNGFAEAVGIITYFFADDTASFFPGFVKPYWAITINNIGYTKLSPTVFEQFSLFKFATLEHSDGIAQDWRYVDIGRPVQHFSSEDFEEYYEERYSKF